MSIINSAGLIGFEASKVVREYVNQLQKAEILDEVHSWRLSGDSLTELITICKLCTESVVWKDQEKDYCVGQIKNQNRFEF